MKKLLLLSLLAMTIALGVSGCTTQDTGSRQYIPGEGWVPS